VKPPHFFPRDGLIFSQPLHAITYSEFVFKFPGHFPLHIMALAQPLKIDHTIDDRATQPVFRNNVIPFPSSRILLPVSFVRESEEKTRAQVRALLHSPLGVYVTRTEQVRNEMHVHFQIASDDLDFTLHTLIATLPEATIGRVSRQRVKAEAR
jgi:hypothetical protein